MGHRAHLRPLFASVSMLALLAAPAATAQDDTPGLFTRLGRVVLGFGAERVAIDTPQAVTVLDQADIDDTQPTTVAELFDFVPGTQAIGSDRVGGLSFNIRGVGELSASDESKIIVTVDGATKFYEQYRMGSFFADPELYKRVEVLRGPASATLYGSGALGGVINFETKDPGDFIAADATNALRLKYSYDSNGQGNLGSVIYATRPSDRVEMLGALTYRTAENYEDGDGREIEGSEFDAASALVKGTYHFGDGLSQSLTASYSLWDSEADDTAYSQTGSLSAFGTIDRDIRDQTVSLRWQNPAPGNPWIDLDAVLSYSNTEVEQYNASAPIPSPLFEDSDYAYRTTSLKVENTARMSGPAWENYLTFGMQVSHQEREAQATSGNILFHPEGTDDKIGLFAQSELILGERLTLIPGIRADFVSLDPDSSIPDTRSVDETAISPKLAVMYDVNDAISVFGSVARTERVATLDELFSTGPGEAASLSLDPETAKSAELGFAWSREGVLAPSDAMQLKTTAFYSDVQDLIARDNTVGTPYYRNVDEAELWGVEVEAAYESERAFARLAYSDVRGEDKATGETLSSVPAQSLALSLGGRVPAHGLDYGWRGQLVDSIAYGTQSFDSYTLHEVFVDWTPEGGALEGMNVRASVENLFDETYQNSLSGDYGRGRTYKLTLSKAIDW
ncbi:TonB-dependent receptor [Mesobaculum littorinae]|uniref:TonB-dependent receptor n=1 Tax=Mesobaculum littorinae TaxID=2486419 RepID=A0A438AIP9_9RHOB|nr:TonB-dependent receptor [Mesobaculum littorinae]RVV98556.1 TonB-dependent receptor [Mesobaculum littorinae]